MQSDLERYGAAMLTGNVDACARIEQKHDLYGYPPEIVCIGLRAVADGQDMNAAIDDYVRGET
ncbi:hypothetical protein [Schauerella aestuarii]|uniref:hypothetical protein n=1 Tax=Schauerella aestuarii TaxID=2511204 RepID=UPI00136B71EA|nr:hypothetical protein [Achromobacter aestuarii]MYZ41390.1 hypothetical protein [Achromobacter aestuarii]